MTNTVDETTHVSLKWKSAKQLAATITASAVVVVGAAAGIVTPIISSSIEHADALAAYTQALEANAAALGSLEEATGSVASAQAEASGLVAPTEQITTIIRNNGEMFGGTERATALDGVITDILDVALITRTETGELAVGQIAAAEFPASPTLSADASTEELKAAAAKVAEITASVTAEAEELTEQATEIHSAIEMVEITKRDVVDAAVTAGTAWERPEKTTDEAWNLFKATIAALESATTAAEADVIIKNYADARWAAQQIHNDQVAAQEAARAAEEASRTYEGRGWSNSTGGGLPTNGGGDLSSLIPHDPDATTSCEGITIGICGMEHF